jgi:hypothetical protein
MSLYQVDKLLFALFNDLEALREVNAGELYRMGAHSFLLWQFSRLMDLKPAIYFKQVRGE